MPRPAGLALVARPGRIAPAPAPRTVGPMRTTTALDIGVDLDGVCYPFVPALRKHVAARTGRPVRTMPNPTRWDFAQEWSMTTDELWHWIRDGVADGDLYLVGDPYPGVVAGLERLRSAGARIHVVTDRPPGAARDRTRAWLAAHALAYDTLTFTGDKTSVPTAAFIDDKPENYAALAQAGVDAYLRSHAYNAHVHTPPRRRVAGFTAFTAQVLSAA